jgi:hypothetical protein
LDAEITVVDIAEILAVIAGFTGPLFLDKKIGGLMLPSLIQGYMVAGNKDRWVSGIKKVVRANRLFMLFLALDAFSILHEAFSAFTYEGGFSLRNVARYLKMNAQCIWSEDRCMPKAGAEERRNGLYFWLGFLEGALLYQLKIRTWGSRLIGAPPLLIPTQLTRSATAPAR